MKKELKKIVDGYFDIYPDNEKLYATDDGNVFLDKVPAHDHAVKTKQKLHIADNPKIEEVAAKNKAKKEAAKKAAEEAEAQKKADAEAAAKKAAEEEKERAKKAGEITPEALLLETDLDSIKYNDAVELANNLKLELKDKKAKTVSAALAAKKKELTK